MKLVHEATSTHEALTVRVVEIVAAACPATHLSVHVKHS